MKWVEPKVFKIAETTINREAIKEFLKGIGAEDWLEKQDWLRPGPRGELDEGAILIEIAGRTCYRSFGVGLNPNVTRIRENRRDYLTNVISKGDGSTLEHSGASWIFADVSRVFTHELVRHRAGVAISQESLRYVRPKELRMTLVPGSELARLENLDDVTRALEDLERRYFELADRIIQPQMKFDEKKGWTSALRRALPDGIATNIVWSANHRTMRWVLEMRTAPSAEVEMRFVIDKMGQILQRDHPDLYGDFKRIPHEDGVGAQWVPQLRSKV